VLAAHHHSQVWAIKDQSTGQSLLGCGECLDRPVCGGLHVVNGGADALTCLSMCRCEDRDKCDYVCPRATSRYLRRLDEVGGFEFDDIPIAASVELPALPDFALLLEGNVTPRRPMRDLDYVAVPLSMALVRRGQRDRAKSAGELQRSFGAVPNRGWIASGVERDPRVERMWRLPEPKKVFEAMKRSGVSFATSPNYSTYADSPRHDNLHAMKRIAWSWFYMVESGIPTALHLNGRTDHDFERWAQFAKRQMNLKAVAFEFLTGAEPLEDGARYVRRLVEFTETSGRKDLVLVLRGGTNWVSELAPHFRRVVMLDSGPYFKTVKRQRLVVDPDGRVKYRSQRTTSAAEMRDLLRHNLEHKLAHHRGTLMPPAQAQLRFEHSPDSSPPQGETHDESSQIDLFAQ
jgi:hypothetical protein